LSPESQFESQKSGRFNIRSMVARSSFRLAYNVLQACAAPHEYKTIFWRR
jgi:hypothetical protein